jgi:predicted metal-dependent phosphoesterase TrpH
MRIDLHVHTHISPCSRLDPEEMVRAALQAGLDGVCVTDHDTMEIRRHLREGVQENGLVVLFGMEYATPQGDFLLFGPFEELPPGWEAPLVLEETSRRGGAAVAAHPFRKGRSLCPNLARVGQEFLIERYNGRNSAEENDSAASLVARFGLRAAAGSDAHSVEELGRCATVFSEPVLTREQLVQALLRGACTPEQRRPRPAPFPGAPGASTGRDSATLSSLRC